MRDCLASTRTARYQGIEGQKVGESTLGGVMGNCVAIGFGWAAN
jgi:hypothetical protein